MGRSGQNPDPANQERDAFNSSGRVNHYKVVNNGAFSTSRHSGVRHWGKLAGAPPFEEQEDAPIKLVSQHWEWLGEYYSTAFLFYHRVTPFYQYGRDCGFVALAMAASIIGRRLEVPRMVVWSRRQGFTNFGEMFDIQNLKAASDHFLQRPSAVIPFPDKNSMIADLVNGRVFLVPYDAGRVLGRPVNRNGMWAHWVLVFGVLVLHSGTPPTFERLTSLLANRPTYRGDPEYSSCRRPGVEMEYLLTQHGWKPCEPDIWPYEDLRESCMQLNCIESHVLFNCIVPEGGIRKGLRGKALRIDL